MTLAWLSIVIFLPLLSIAILLAFTRLLRGPSLPDRVIALDLMATFGVGMVGTYAVATNQPALLDVGLVLALLVFLSTIAFAYFIERSAES